MTNRAVLIAAFATVGLSLAAGGCSSVKSYHGFLTDEAKPSEVAAGMDTKSTVLNRLGSPSTKSTFERDIWYYVHAKREQFAYNKAETIEREVTEITFGPDDRVESVRTYDLNDARYVDIADGKTPTLGRELNVFEQIFGNIGRGSLPVDD